LRQELDPVSVGLRAFTDLHKKRVSITTSLTFVELPFPLSFEMLDAISILSISGFRSPNLKRTEYGTTQPPVIISSGDLMLNIAHSRQEFTLTIQHNFPPYSSTTPYGVQLVLPFHYLASIFILDHGFHGRSVRIRLISPSQAFKLDKHAIVPSHKRYMLDEHAQPALLYPLHMNDHFDLLGILQSREFVAHIPPTIKMESLVDWGARLKDAAASIDGTTVQVLFDNMDTGRVSQLQSLPAQLQNIPFTKQSKKSDFVQNANRIRKNGESRHSEGTSAFSTRFSISSDESYGRLTPYTSNGKGRCSESPSPDRYYEGEGLWVLRRRTPNSPGRYYRPKSSSKYYRPSKHGKYSSNSKRNNSSRSLGKGEELTDGSSSLIATEIKVAEMKAEVVALEMKVEEVSVGAS
jgi:hypothetical protein